MGREPWAEGTAGEKKGQQRDRASSQTTRLPEEGGCAKECGLNLQPLKMEIFKMEEKKVRVVCNGRETRAVSLKDTMAFSLKV